MSLEFRTTLRWMV